MNRLKERIQAFGGAVRSKLPKNRDAEVESLAAMVKRQSREIDVLQSRMNEMDCGWKTDLDSLLHCQKRVQELETQLNASRETFRQATAANEQLSDLLASLRSQNRELQAQVAAARTIKGVWDAAESMLDLSMLLGSRIEKFKRDVGQAYLMDVSAKN